MYLWDQIIPVPTPTYLLLPIYPSTHLIELPWHPSLYPFTYPETHSPAPTPTHSPIIHTYTFYTLERSPIHSFPHPATYPLTYLPNSSSNLSIHSSKQSYTYPSLIHSPIQQTTVNQTLILPHWLKRCFLTAYTLLEVDGDFFDSFFFL